MVKYNIKSRKRTVLEENKMRPHTRTQCNDGKDCVECGQGGLPQGALPSPNGVDNLNEIGVSLQHASNSKYAPAGQVDSASSHQHKTDKRSVYC